MLPVFRWCLCGLGALWSCAALAQAAPAQPEVDESKIPEWVKRQARSPYKVIIESNTVKTKPAPPKEEPAAKTAVKKPLPLRASPADTDKPPAALANNSASPAPIVAQPLAAPSAPVETAAVSAAPAPAPAPQPAATIAAAPEAALAAVAVPAAVAAEPAPLTLLKRIEPVLSPDLLDSRLNTAKVVVAFTVMASGEVSNLSIASTTDSRLNRAVLRALQAWRYAPIPEPREHMVSFAFATE